MACYHTLLRIMALVIHVLSQDCDKKDTMSKSKSKQETRSESGIFTSPNFGPNKLYNPDEFVTAVVKGKGFRKFTINITHFQLEASELCKHDKLNIYTVFNESLKDQGGVRIGPLCGKLSDFESDNNITKYCSISGKPSSMVCELVSGGFTMTFETDNCGEESGYEIKYHSTKATTSDICSAMVPTPKTKEKMEVTEEVVRISTSFLYVDSLYPPTVSCNWSWPKYNATVPRFVKDVTMRITYFSIEHSGSDCPNDNVEIRDLERRSDENSTAEQVPGKVLDKFCGCMCQFTKFIRDVDGIWVKFDTTNVTDDNKFDDKIDSKIGGFEIVFRLNYIKEKRKINKEKQINVTDTPTGNLSIAELAEDMNCSEDAICNYVIKFVAEHGSQINLKVFQENDTEISAYDGPDVGYKELNYSNPDFMKELFGWANDTVVGFLSGGLYLTIKVGPNAVNSTANISAVSRSVFMLTSYRLINCQVSGVSMGILSENTITHVEIKRTRSNVNNYICYLVMTVPKDNTVNLTVSGSLEKSSSSDEPNDNCETNGIVVYVESLNNNKEVYCGTQIEKIAAVPTSHRVFIMMYLYAMEGGERGSEIKLDISTSRDAGTSTPSLIDDCTGNTTKSTQGFPGFIDSKKLHSGPTTTSTQGTCQGGCFITLQLTGKSNVQKPVKARYIELYIHQYYGQKLKIIETINEVEIGKTIQRGGQQFLLTHVTFKSMCTKLLVIEVSESFAQIEYQLKTYTDMPSNVTDDGDKYEEMHKEIDEIRKTNGNTDTTDSESGNTDNKKKNSHNECDTDTHTLDKTIETVYTHDHAYVLQYNKKKTMQDAEKLCKRYNGTLFSASNVKELEAVKTAFSTRWRKVLLSHGTKPQWSDVLIGLKNTKTPTKDSPETSEWRWTDGSPLTISDWYYPDILDHYIPDEIQSLRQDAFTVQPVVDRGYDCTTMGIHSPRQSTNWKTIDCENIPSYVKLLICEVRNKTIKERTDNVTAMLEEDIRSEKVSGTYKRKQFDVNSTCPKNWTHIDGKCWLMLHTNYSSDLHSHYHDVSLVDKLCSDYGGQIADLTDLNIIKQYMTYTQYHEAYGNILIQNNGTDACIHYRLRKNLVEEELDRLEIGIGEECNTNMVVEYQGSEVNSGVHAKLTKDYYPWHCDFDDVQIWNDSDKVVNVIKIFTVSCFPNHVFCTRDLDIIPDTCKTGYMKCGDGSCVSPDLICDDEPDCPDGQDEQDCDLPDYYYNCTDGKNITISKYCDHVNDCDDGSDENDCKDPNCIKGQYRCENGQCVDEAKRCDGRENGCVDKSDNKNCKRHECDKGTYCMEGTCMSKDRRNDGKADCKYATDEPYVSNYTKMYHLNAVDQKSETCPPEYGRCSIRNVGCFNRGEACVLGYESDGRMKGCGDGKHLSDCSTFDCPGRYKCPNSYCIDMKRVCNGIKDCQYGEDEAECHDDHSPKLYRCGKSLNYSIDNTQICNGEFDCRHSGYQSDEKYCVLPECPKGCTCRGFYYNCEGNITNPLTISNANFSNSARMLNLAGNNLGDIIAQRLDFSKMTYLAILRLSSNKLTRLDKVIGNDTTSIFSNLKNLLILDLRNNSITNLGKNLFLDLSSLMQLNLSGNPIAELDSHTFAGLSMIYHLNLSNLEISTVKNGSLHGLEQLRVLDLSENRITEIEVGVFKKEHKFHRVIVATLDHINHNNLDDTNMSIFRDITSDFIEAGSFRFCCFRNKNVNCTPSDDIYSTCADLMGNKFLQIMVWVIGSLAVLGNMAVIIVRPILGMKNPSEVCIFALSCSDLLTGIYLLILASVDSHYRGKYIENDVAWRSSGLCTLCGILSTLSAQLSSFLLLLITVDRFIHLVFPMKGIKYSRKTTAIVCVVLCIGSLIACIIPLSSTEYFGEYYSKTALCLAYDFTSRSKGWEYTVAMFISVNLFNCIVTLVCYIIIYFSVRHSSKKSDPTRKGDIQLAKTLFLLVLTDLVCWFPLIIATLNAINGGKVTPEMAALLAVVILPINAALNPYLYTISSVQNARARRKTERRGRKGPGQNPQVTDGSQSYPPTSGKSNPTAESVVSRTSADRDRDGDTVKRDPQQLAIQDSGAVPATQSSHPTGTAHPSASPRPPGTPHPSGTPRSALPRQEGHVTSSPDVSTQESQPLRAADDKVTTAIVHDKRSPRQQERRCLLAAGEDIHNLAVQQTKYTTEDDSRCPLSRAGETRGSKHTLV